MTKMSNSEEYILKNFNPDLDLKLERVIDVPVEIVWEAWTTPKHIKEWFCPKPWQVTECKIELFPGGTFFTVMEGPEGEKFTNPGCFLEIVKNRKLVWTDAMLPGYRLKTEKNPHLDFHFTALLLFEPEGSGTKYTAVVIHGDESAQKKHAEIGFHEGWSKALDQLVEYMKGL